MPIKTVKKNEKVDVSVELSFEGTIYNHIVTVENQHLPTVNNQVKAKKIALDGDPITIIARFKGEPGSSIKKFAVTINSKSRIHKDIKLKTGEQEIREPIPYGYFQLKEM